MKRYFGHEDWRTCADVTALAPVPPTIPRPNPKPDQNLSRSGSKRTPPITTKFRTRHDSVTVTTCAKPPHDRPITPQTKPPPKPRSKPEPDRNTVSGIDAWSALSVPGHEPHSARGPNNPSKYISNSTTDLVVVIIVVLVLLISTSVVVVSSLLLFSYLQ